MLDEIAPPLLLVALLAPLAAVVRPRLGHRPVLAAAVVVTVPAAAALSGTTVELPGIELDRFGGLVQLLVFGVGATVLAFAGRNLRGEAYQERFVRVASVLVPVSASVAMASHHLVLAAAWVATSLATVALVRTGPTGGVEARSLRLRRAFLVGDACFVVAMVLLHLEVGPTAVAGLLVVVAAAARSASGPFLRWLPDSLGAPTPSSALLHAGVVNGGAIVLIRLAPVTAEVAIVALAAVIVGGLTCVVAEAVMLTRPDVKGQLAWSTIAQMSFTMLLCGAGLHVAAALHLVAHGLYKGALFLGSGASVRALVRRRTAPGVRAEHRPVATVVAFALTGATMLLVASVAGASATGDTLVPLALAWVAAGCATAAALHRARGIRHVTVLSIGSALVGIYAVVSLELKDLIGPAVAVADPALPALVVVPVLAALVLVAATRDHRGAPDSALASAWRRARALGRPKAAPTLELPGPFAWRPDVPAPIHQQALQHGA